MKGKRSKTVVFVGYFVLLCILYTAWESDMEISPPDSLMTTFVFLAGLVGFWYVLRTSGLFLHRLHPGLHSIVTAGATLVFALLFAEMLFYQMKNAAMKGTPLYIVYFAVLVVVFQSCTAAAYEFERNHPRIAHKLFLSNKKHKKKKTR